MKISLQNKINLFLISMVLLCFVACKKKDKDEEPTPDESFDKAGMLANIGDNIILPAYQTFKVKVDSLHYFTAQFTATPTSATLDGLKTRFMEAYRAYQWISAFELGPAETDIIRANFNTFPCDTAQVNANVTSGVYDLATISNIDAKGFSAIDFLLYRSNQNDTYIISMFSGSTNAKNYLTALVNELKTKTDALNTSWSASGGNYLAAFKSSTGSDVGGSIGMLVNQLNFDFEILKNARIGIPLGKKTLGIALPDKVEAFYNQQSVALVLENIKSIENIYLGRNKQNAGGLGLDDYLAHVNAQHSSGSLNDAIKNKFISAKSKLAIITGPLSQAVINNTATVDVAYMELQQLVVLLKVDMPSALGVLITYQDNDGD